ncbi:hypothetical protein SAMD00079811_83160 (plasmid) [Scytonema sp. HK-05]|uniref:hypothetical protein n=1 Tax=Scytonema sp. HK-05 TaxID=1137095 RepID=UPI0009679991|nr:hypothetical protein [Scytonema sp. HK-05]OKH44716.1 hypothetical protein NIES2130_37805 [Scytonema sp. HK-05]BAY50685.1 hypothetical protein SAMD00079811_83160 [Scytonema sp. HK-05]
MKTQLHLTLQERSHLRELILSQRLTESLDFLRKAASRQFLSHRTRITEEMLVQYLATWQRILSVSETSERERQLSDSA